MPVIHTLWTVGEHPVEVTGGALQSEKLLEEMIEHEPRILSDDWMLIGRQIETDRGGRIDLLAIAPDGSLVMIELKKDRTPRDVVAQALDYAAWVDTLDADDIAAIFRKFSQGEDLSTAFQKRFGRYLDEDELNNSHQVVIVASSLDHRTERIVNYLNARNIPINVLFFQVFNHDRTQFLSRVWLLDPVETQTNASSATRSPKEPWNGEFYVSFGHGEQRDWDEARELGFLSAGGGSWYSGTLKLLAPGDRIWVKAPGFGFVGVGRVSGVATPISDFRISDAPATVVLKATYHREFANDPDRSEYFVPVDWLETVPIDSAVQETGMFGNQNTVCKPRTPVWRSTIDRLKLRFPQYDASSAAE